MQSPFVMVIFGATGDLMRAKLLPALFKIYLEKKLPEKFYIVGFARRNFTDNEFRGMFFERVGSISPKDWGEFARHLYYQQGLFGEKEGYDALTTKLKEFDEKENSCLTRFFYLATPPANYQEILDHLEYSKLAEGCGSPKSFNHEAGRWTRIIIEKPFGKDLETAKMLDKRLAQIFEERQIFRVDHYLGKETVQNMLAFRFANGIFEPVWNKNYIDHVQILLAEEKGVEKRGKFFDGVGWLRDMAQNHIIQLIAQVAMEPPKSFSKEGIRDARAEAIKSIRDIEPKDVDKFVVRGQYEGYKKEKDIDEKSDTETFMALKAFVDTPRFQGVPFYIKGGKKLPKSLVEISVVFIQTCHILFREYGCPEIGNVLTIRIQPDEGIKIKIIAKKPGSRLSLGTVDLKFAYREEFGSAGADAYEKLLLDIFAGDQVLFNRSDELESSWNFITKILEGWSKSKSKPVQYKTGTWGPKEAEDLIERDGRRWIKP